MPLREKSRQRQAEGALTDQMNIVPKGQLFVILAVLSAAMLATFMDQNGVSVTIPIIGKSLDAQDTISWAGTSSLIANTIFSVLYGRLSDIWGRKIVFLSALVVLAFADLMCALSQNGPMLYFFRAVAGAAGGGVTNLTMMILSDVCTLEQRGKYQGILGANVGIGNVAGPFIAAAFLSLRDEEYRGLGAGWRCFFYFLGPLVLTCAIVVAMVLPSFQKQAKKEAKEKDPQAEVLSGVASIKMFDWVGIFFATFAVAFILIPISGGGAYFEWDSPLVIGMLTVGCLCFMGFVLWEWKWAKLPMIPSK